MPRDGRVYLKVYLLPRDGRPTWRFISCHVMAGCNHRFINCHGVMRSGLLTVYDGYMVRYIVGLRLKYMHFNIFGYGIFMVIFL